MTEKPHISPTQLTMHSKCPEQYRRRYVEGERLPPGIALITGSGVHGGIEVNMRQKVESHEDLRAAEIQEAASAAFDARVCGGVMFTPEEASTGVKKVLGQAKDQTVQLAATHAEEQAPDYQPVEVEHTTRIILPDCSHDLLGITDLRDDQGRVIDFKTSGKKTPQADADRSIQLTAYAGAYQIDYGKPPSELRLDVLVKTKKPYRHLVKTHRRRSYFCALAARIEIMLEAIKAGSFPPGAPDWWCSPKFCGYWSTCKYQPEVYEDGDHD